MVVVAEVVMTTTVVVVEVVTPAKEAKVACLLAFFVAHLSGRIQTRQHNQRTANNASSQNIPFPNQRIKQWR